MKKLKYIGIIFLTVLAVSACKKDSKNENGNGTDPCSKLSNLLSEELIRSSMELDQSIEIERDLDLVHNYIGYQWSTGETFETRVFYSASLNFWECTPNSVSALEGNWESQNKTIYQNRDMEIVEGVGRKASWSNLGGGQLRVITDKYLFYISFSSNQNKDAKIAVTSDWARSIISQIE